jgi:endonuclease YncB( thermonuclease family)
MYTYHAQVERVIDGDTLVCLVDLGFGTFRRETFRLLGLDAPELATPEGERAKAFVEEWIATNGRQVVVVTVRDKREKYGRYLALVQNNLGQILNTLLREQQLASLYPGKADP